MATSLPVLGLNPVQAPNPLATLATLSQLHSTQVENLLRQQQIQQSQAQMSDIQAQAQQRQRDLADQNTLKDALKDPSNAQAFGSGNLDFLNGKVSPTFQINTQKALAEAHAQAATASGTDIANNQKWADQMIDAATGLKQMIDNDPAAISGYQAMIQELRSEGNKLADKAPDKITTSDEFDQAMTSLHVYAGIQQKAAALKEAQQKPVTAAAEAGKANAEAGKANADAANANADAAMSTFKLGLMKGATDPAALSSGIDALIDPAKYPQANKDAKAAAAVEARSGDPAKIADAVKSIYDEQVGKPAGAAATVAAETPAKVAQQAAMLPGEVKKAAATASAAAYAEIAPAVKKQAALAAASPEMFSGIADPSSRRAAQADYQKLTEDYLDKAQAAQQMKDFIAAAQSGNKAAPGLLGITELRTIVNRINGRELDAISKGAGSVVDRVQGWFNGHVDGQPVPPDIMKGMNEIADIQARAARGIYENKVTALGATYGGNVKPVPPPVSSAAKPVANKAEFDALPSGALYVDPADHKTYRKP
jgi:hypothetical protein